MNSILQSAHRNDLKAGQVVIAQPDIPELTYRQSVILITDIDQFITTGIILNQPCAVYVNTLFEEFPVYDHLFYGGPIQSDMVTFLHKNIEFPGAKELGNGFAWGADQEFVSEWLIKESNPIASIRFYAGYITWKNEDIQSELKNNYWWPANISPDECFTTNGNNLHSYLLSRDNLAEKFKIDSPN